MPACRTLFLLVILAPCLRAEVKLHPLFTDHMVLQRGVPVPVTGTATPGETLTVTGPGGVTATATADADGTFTATLPAMKPGTGFTLKVQGTSTQELQDVLVGDVWICSGQSNMEWSLAQLDRNDQGKTVAAQATNPQIRLFDVPNRTAGEPKTSIELSGRSGKWLECTPENVLKFSAVGYFFGRDIQATQNVPVGLIASEWGGTPCEAWTSLEKLQTEPTLSRHLDRVATDRQAAADPAAAAKYEAELAAWKKAVDTARTDGKQPPRMPLKPGLSQYTPAALFNAMIAPLTRFPITGVIWYQGESNASYAREYYKLFPAMIQDWRARWGTDFPFLVVQLAPFRADGSEKVSYAELRDAQRHAADTLPKVGLAVITDVGEETDIHPQRKEPVGQRLALAARKIAYGEDIVASGPTFKELTIDGDRAVVTFAHGPLAVKGDTAHGFTLAGADNVFHPATAEIKGDTVVLRSEQVPNPVALRFGWVNFAQPELNLFNAAGLPAVPFRTDDLPLTTR